MYRCIASVALSSLFLGALVSPAVTPRARACDSVKVCSSLHASAAREATPHASCETDAACIDLPDAGLSACLAPGTDPDYADAAVALLAGVGPQPYSLGSRWSNTATNGGTGTNGTPVTLTYSFVPDFSTGDPTTSNVIHATFDVQFGTRAAWKALFRRIFDDWSAQSGITFVEVADDGAAWPNSMGSLGVRGDIRILSWEIDGVYGVLAYNYYPNFGDMAIDKDEDWADDADDYRFFRNTIMHELGHGLGLQHVLPRDGTKLMEAFLNTGFDGPQDDDVRGVNAYYGDSFEPNASSASAAALGTISAPTTFAELSLHGPSDADWYIVNAAAGTSITAAVAPVGGSYNVGPDPGTPTAIDTRALNALRIEVYNQSGGTLLTSATAAAAGQSATADVVVVPTGQAGLQIKVFTSGSAAQVQRYALTVTPQGGGGTYSLLLGSNTGAAVPISFSPPALGGATSVQTPTAVAFASGVTVSLTAAATFAGDTFAYWEIDSAPQTPGDRTVEVAMNANRAARVVYGDTIAVEAGVAQAIIAGESATLTATASGGTPPYSYIWSPSASLSSSTAASIVVSPNSTTTYTVTVSDALGATAADDVTVQVSPALSVYAGADQVVGPGSRFTLTASASGGVGPYSYEWSPAVASADSLVGASLEASVGVTTTFTVAVTDADGRIASDSVIVSVPPRPTVTAGADVVLIAGSAALLSANATGGLPPYRYTWEPPGVELGDDGQVVRVTPSANTDYVVTVTDSVGQEADDTIRVSLATAVQVTAIADPPTIDPGGAAILQTAVNGGVPPYSYAWSPSDDLTAPEAGRTWAAPSDPTTYAVVVTDSLGQSTTATVRVIVTVVASAPAFENLAPVVPSPCGFGFAMAAPCMVVGVCSMRRRFVHRR